MKVLFCLLPERGHVNPFIGPAQALQARGHEVRVISAGDLSEQMGASGLEFDRSMVDPGFTNLKGKALVELVEDRSRHRALIEDVFLKGAVVQVPPLLEYFRSEAPDILVLDPMHYAGVIAAELSGVPWVGMSSSLTSVLPNGLQSEALKLVEILAPERESLFARFGLKTRFRAVDALSPFLNISFSTREFVGTPVDNVHTVGPSRVLKARGDDAPLKPLPTNRRIVYASFGSQAFYFPSHFKKIVKAATQLNVHLVASIGDLANEPGWEDTEHCQFYSYALQLELLKRTSLFITHGGANSVMEAICAGVPMLIHPICNDQDHQAFFIERSATGQRVDLDSVDEDGLAQRIDDALENYDLVRNMKRVSRSYQVNGSLKACRLIEGLYRTGLEQGHERQVPAYE